MGTCMSGYNMQCLTMDIVGNAFGEAHALSKMVDFEKEQAQCSHRDKRRTYLCQSKVIGPSVPAFCKVFICC
jgi:hypothetical protein